MLCAVLHILKPFQDNLYHLWLEKNNWSLKYIYGVMSVQYSSWFNELHFALCTLLGFSFVTKDKRSAFCAFRLYCIISPQKKRFYGSDYNKCFHLHNLLCFCLYGLSMIQGLTIILSSICFLGRQKINETKYSICVQSPLFLCFI